jgi:hypothetical protein
LFLHIRIIVKADGAFGAKIFLNDVLVAQMRIRSNCVVDYQAHRIALRDIKTLKPKGRQMMCTISVVWHDISQYITAQRRIDKYEKESVVYLALILIPVNVWKDIEKMITKMALESSNR